MSAMEHNSPWLADKWKNVWNCWAVEVIFIVFILAWTKHSYLRSFNCKKKHILQKKKPKNQLCLNNLQFMGKCTDFWQLLRLFYEVVRWFLSFSPEIFLNHSFITLNNNVIYFFTEINDVLLSRKKIVKKIKKTTLEYSSWLSHQYWSKPKLLMYQMVFHRIFKFASI